MTVIPCEVQRCRGEYIRICNTVFHDQRGDDEGCQRCGPVATVIWHSPGMLHNPALRQIRQMIIGKD
jgi:hypothetical protein